MSPRSASVFLVLVFMLLGSTRSTCQTINSLSPTSGTSGTVVTISGAGFGATQGNSSVTFNGTTAATVNSWSNGTILATVPFSATTGSVIVTVAGVPSNGAAFTVLPRIDVATPSSGAVGSVVRLDGDGFGATRGTGGVTVNGTPASVTSWSSSAVNFVIPSGAVTGNVVLTTSAGLTSNNLTFTIVPPPSISSLSPASGAANSTVTINGSNFGGSRGTGGVTFGVRSATINSWTDTSISAKVPSSASTGSVVVKAAGGVASNGVTFTIPPVIADLSPNSGAVGAYIFISGSSLGNSIGSVSFNGVNAPFVASWNSTGILAPVPTGATTGNLVVTSSGGTASNSLLFTVLSPPVISFLTQPAGRPGMGLTIVGSNFGASQNGGTVTFNGQPAVVGTWSDGSITTTVPAGVHTGPVVVTTQGGPSNGAQFIFAPGIRTQAQPLYVTPDEISLEAGGSGAFKVVDPSGNAVLDATWTVDSPTLATITADDPTLPTATLQALAPGEVTITATSSLGTAQAKATIFGAGLMPDGTASWGFYPETQDNFFDFKIRSRRNKESDPYLYLPEGTNDFTHLSAISENGQLMWRITLNPVDPSHTFSFPVGAAGTNDGGVLVHSLEGGDFDSFTAIRRYGPDGTPRWTYRGTSDAFTEPAIGHDGTIYVLDMPTLIAIKDTDGTEKFRFTPGGGNWSFSSSEQPGSTNPDGSAVSPTNPWKPCADFFPPGSFSPPRPTPGNAVSFEYVIGTDGNPYMMSTADSSSFNYDRCQIVKVGNDPITNAPVYVVTAISGQLQYNGSAQLIAVNSSGGGATTQVGSVSYSGQAGFGFDGTRNWIFNNGASQLPSIHFDHLVPDADGGLLMTWTQQSSTLGSAPQSSLTKVLNGAPVGTFSITASGNMATNDQGTVFFYQKGNFSPVGDTVTALDILSGVPKWTIPGTLLFATDDGGALIQTGFVVVHADANGVLDQNVLAVGGTASYLAIGTFQVAGQAGSVTSVPTSVTSLNQIIAGAYPVPVLGTPARQHQPINIVLKEVRQQGIVPNGVTESQGCTGVDIGPAPRVDFGSLMAPVQATETSTDANGNPVTSQTPANNVVSMKNNSQHPITLVPHIPAFNGQPADTTVRVTISPQTLPADGQYHDITFTGVAASDINRPVRIEAFDNTTAENRGDIMQVDVRSWHRWFIDYYAVSELNGRLQPTPPLQTTLQAELDRIFVPQANLGFTLTNKGAVADDYDVSPTDNKLHVPIFIDPITGTHSTCDLGFTSLGAINPSCTDDTELTPMYQRLITAQRQASQNQVIDLDNQDMFYLLYFKNFDNAGIGGFSDPTLDSFRRRLPSVVHTDYANFPNTLNQDRFNAITSAHEIAHKLGRAGHYDPTAPNAVYLMVKTFSIVSSVVQSRSDDKNYPCRLGRTDWNKVNYVYPTPR